MNNFIKCSNIVLKKLFIYIYIINILWVYYMYGEGMYGMSMFNECKCWKIIYRYCFELLILCWVIEKLK